VLILFLPVSPVSFVVEAFYSKEKESFKMMKVVLVALAAIAVRAAPAPAPAGFEYKEVPAEVELVPAYVNVAPSTVEVTEIETVEVFVDTEYEEYETVGEYEYSGMVIASYENDEHAPERCTDAEVKDCDGVCAPAYWIANGFCDDGDDHNKKTDDGVIYMQPIEKGTSNFKRYNFKCDEFWMDGGDCESTADRVKSNYVASGINGGVVFMQKVTPSTPVLAMGILAVVATVGVVMKRN